MTRILQDREDLLREAKALTQRVELKIAGTDQSLEVNLVAGFHKNRAMSIYFTPDHAYHFNTQNQLRRAFIEGTKYKAENGKLYSLQRAADDGHMKFTAVELSEKQIQQRRQQYNQYKNLLVEALQQNQYQLVGQVPADGNVVEQVKAWLQQSGETLEFATSASVLN